MAKSSCACRPILCSWCAHPCHICTGTGHSLPHLHRDWAQPATSAPGLQALKSNMTFATDSAIDGVEVRTFSHPSVLEYCTLKYPWHPTARERRLPADVALRCVMACVAPHTVMPCCNVLYFIATCCTAKRGCRRHVASCHGPHRPLTCLSLTSAALAACLRCAQWSGLVRSQHKCATPPTV